MEQEAEFLIPASNEYLYRDTIDEMGENAKRQDGGYKMLSISI